jgi:hemerythrin-like domain-containing protein
MPGVYMHKIIEQLQQYHRQLMRVLYHLDKEITRFSLHCIKPNCSDKILDILTYIQIYPELWHHPAEDIIFSQAIHSGLDSQGKLQQVIMEHEALALLTEQLLTQFNAFVSTTQQSPSKLIKSCRTYIDKQLNHIHREQEELFPILAGLSSNDWQRISQQLKQHRPQWQDEDTPSAPYHQIYQNILQSSAITAH